MNVLMLGRYHLMEQGGGDKVQIENTARELKMLGVDVEIKTDDHFDPAKYDLIHVFQLDWTPETYFYIKKTFKAKRPVVLSPIHHDISEVKKFDDEYVFDFRRLSKLLFKNQFHRDTFKNVYRSVLDYKKLKPTLFSVFYGFEKMQKKALEMSDKVLVQTELEARDLEKTFGIKINYEIVRNGVSTHFIKKGDLGNNPLGISDYIICVGRIEPRKNQLNVIEAVKNLRKDTGRDLKLVLVGTEAGSKHFEYNILFHKQLTENSWVHHIEKVSYGEMPNYYRNAKVCVSASWFETTGLTSLEALFCGTNAVAAGKRAKEYLKDYVSYCQPWDVSSIEKAIFNELGAPRPQIADELRKDYTWEKAAAKTLQIYEEVLAKWKK